jgi:anti-anti-sigma factor
MDPDSGFTITAGEHGFALRGEIDVRAADALANALVAFVGRTATVDMSEVTFMDSTGLAAFLEARIRGVNVRLVHVTPRVRQVFEVTSLLDLLVCDEP